MSTQRRHNAYAAAVGRGYAPVDTAFVFAFLIFIEISRFACERSRERVHHIVGKARHLGRGQAVFTVVIALGQIVGTEHRAHSCPYIGAEVFGPTSATRVPRFHIGAYMILHVEVDMLFKDISPTGGLGMVGEKICRESGHRLDIGEEIGMSAEHVAHGHVFLPCSHVCMDEEHGREAAPQLIRHLRAEHTHQPGVVFIEEARG